MITVSSETRPGFFSKIFHDGEIGPNGRVAGDFVCLPGGNSESFGKIHDSEFLDIFRCGASIEDQVIDGTSRAVRRKIGSGGDEVRDRRNGP